MDNDEAISTLLLFTGYGGEILRMLISGGLRLLLSDARFAGDLTGGRLSVDDALDEVLWNDPPVANRSPHYPVHDVDFHGVRLREGDPVFISFAAANTDPSVALNRRAGNRAHLAWGAGPHTCPAQSQARLVASLAMERLLDRLPDVKLAVPADELEWNPGPLTRAPAALPVRFCATSPRRTAAARGEGPPGVAADAGTGGKPLAQAGANTRVKAGPAGTGGRARGGTVVPVIGALRRAGHLLPAWLGGRRQRP